MSTRRIFFVITLVVMLFTACCAQAQTVPSFSNNAEPAATQDAQAAGTLTGNYLIATINGAETVFTLRSANVIGTGSYNALHVDYVCVSPLGTDEWRLSFWFNLGDPAGTLYQTTSSQKVCRILVTYGVTNMLYGASLARDDSDSESVYELAIISRSADWRTYTGSFRATLLPMPGIANVNPPTLEITDGYFSCTYDGDLT